MAQGCRVADCERGHYAKEYCRLHYKRWKRWGNPDWVGGPPFEDRFWARVEKTDGCWEWKGYRTPQGYGRFGKILPHRKAYELLVGEIPEGLVIDHLCRNPGCVNPEHLEAVTVRENTRRGNGFAGKQHRQTLCKRGHPLSGFNLLVSNGHRLCRMCKWYATQKGRGSNDREVFLD